MAAPVVPQPGTGPKETPEKNDQPPTPTDGGDGGGAPAPAASPFEGLTNEQKERMLTFYMGAARGQESKIRELEERLGKVEKPEVVVTDTGKRNKEFYDKPFETTQEIVKREINEAVAPLKEFVGAFKANSELGRVKDELRNNPRIAQVLQLGEAHVDRLVNEAAAKGAPITRELVMGAIASVKGGLDMGWIPGAEAPPAPPTPSAGGGNPPSPTIPPHLRPSAPPAPAAGTQKKLRELSEEERRLARENKMSEEEYLLALDMPAGSVANPEAWKVGKK